MRQLLSSRDNRLLTIMESLRKEDRTLEYITQTIDVSIKTLNLDVSYINNFFFPIAIMKEKDDKLHLSIPMNSSFSLVYSVFLSNSKEFQLLENIFLNEEKSVKTLADELFYSESSLRRMILRMNKVLEKEEIIIQLTPLKIIGEESAIRSYLLYYFLERYPEGTYSFNRFQKKISHQILIDFMEGNQFSTDYASMEKLHVLMMVSLIRMQQGNRVVFPPLVDKWKYSLDVLNNSVYCRTFKAVFKMELTRDILVGIAPIFFTSNFSSSLSHFEKAFQVNERVGVIGAKFSELIESISQTLEIQCLNKERLILDLTNAYFLNYGEQFILYDLYSEFVDEFNQVQGEWTQFIKKEIEVIFVTSAFSKAETNYYIYLLMTHWNSLYLNLEKNKETPKVGIFFNTDLEHINFVQDMLESYFNDSIQFEVIDSIETQAVFNLFFDYDFVVTNVPNLDYENVICFSVFPNIEDFSNLRESCEYWQLHSEKK